MKAETIAKVLAGRKAGGGWMARCPAHDDREPSLSIRPGAGGKPLVCCHAGCDQGRLIAALRSLGLWDQNGHLQFARNFSRTSDIERPERDEAKRTEVALAIWRATTPADGSLAEIYLASRGLKLPPLPRLRFHARLKHASGRVWPALVALVTCGEDDRPIAIHRTFLARDGTGKAPVDPQRMMLGPCRGGAVRLGAPRDVMMVGEGIETCLAAMLATGHPAWAALSTSGLRTLDLPRTVQQVIVLADGDDPGEAAAQSCSRRWKREGRCVRIARPPQGMDFNDLLVGRASRIMAGAL
jgi:hypothetical protein